MSAFDDARAKVRNLLAAKATPATVERTITTGRGRDIVTTVSTLTGYALLGSRRVRNEDGTYRQEALARTDIAVMTGDTFTIGTKEFTVQSVEEVNPDGGATAIIYLAGLA